MKKIALFPLLCLLSVSNIFSQETKQNKSSIKLKDKNLAVSGLLITLTADNMITEETNTLYNSKAVSPSLGMYYLHDIPFKNSDFSFAPGLGFTFSKTRLDNSTLVQNDLGTSFLSQSYHPLFASGNNTYLESSIYSSWVEVPLELKYSKKFKRAKKKMTLAAGLRAGVKLTANSKVEYRDQVQNRKITLKEKPFSDLNSIRYGLTSRIGYGSLSIFGYYGLNQFIKDKNNYNNQDLKQYSIGLAFSL